MPKAKSPFQFDSVIEARGRLAELADTAARKNKRVLVKRRGEAAAIILSFDDYIDLIAPEPDWMKALDAEVQRTKPKITKRDIDRAIAEVRAEAREAKATKRKAS